MQLCEVLGPYGVSFLVALANAGIAAMALRFAPGRGGVRRCGLRAHLAGAAAIPALILAVHLWGGARFAPLPLVSLQLQSSFSCRQCAKPASPWSLEFDLEQSVNALTSFIQPRSPNSCRS